MAEAIYPGSFDPFTNGHLDIVKKCVQIFDNTHIIIAKNSDKQRKFNAEQMRDCITQVLYDENILQYCNIYVWEGLVADYARRNGITFMVRGLRNNLDYNYEENIAEINKLICPGLEVVYLRANDRAISSSMVREFLKYDLPVEKYLPYKLEKMFKNE